MSTLISLSPYLILIYILFAVIQLVRHQRQSFGAAVLGLIVIAVPLIAYMVSSNLAGRTSLMNAMAVGTTVFCISCIIILMIERRDTKRDKKRSYGILGLGMSVVLAGALVVMTLTQSTATQTPSAAAAAALNTDNFVNVSQSNARPITQDSTTPATTEVAAVLTAQTGLSVADLTTQISSGSTITQLVAAHNGDIEAVKAVIVTSLNTLLSAGGMPAQMLSNFGSDAAEIAAKLVEGQLPAQAQQMLAAQLISGNSARPQGMPPQDGSGGFTPPSGSDASAFPTSGSGNAPTNAQAGGGEVVAPVSPTPSQNNVQVAVVPTEVVIRPTLIAFPTAAPTLDATETPVTVDEAAESTPVPSAVEASATCTIVVVYNLNLRDKPSPEGSTILLSIPYGTTVTSSGHTSDNWYQVTYEGQSGWVSGEYVSPQAACSQLATLSG